MSSPREPIMKRVAVIVPADQSHQVTELASKLREEARERMCAGYRPGGDAIAISRIAREKFGGYREMFIHHGWPERGKDMIPAVQSRVANHYGSVKAFESFYSD